jgi:NitT/TauT family transport system permease protein/taurine transport system permease protein
VTRWERWIGVVPFVTGLGLWWLLAHSGRFRPSTLPTPESVVAALVELAARGELQTDILVSLGRVALGAGISIVLGVSLGVLGGLNPKVGDFLQPLATFFNSVSGIAWIPLAITWFGLGTAAVTFVIVNGIFFLIFFNTMLGVRSVPRIMEYAVRTLGGNQRQLILQVFLPGALPYIMSGIRSGLGFGWRALIAAELIAATSGLGFLIYDASAFTRTDLILAGILVIGVLWMLLDGLVLTPLERRTIERWGTMRAA